jgi:hypothetical protein
VVETHGLVCLVCGRALSEAEAPAFATVVAGETRALCARCGGRPAARRAAAALLSIRPATLERLLAAPGTSREGRGGRTGAPDEHGANASP